MYILSNFIGVELIYNVVLVLRAQQSDSVPHIHLFRLPWWLSSQKNLPEMQETCRRCRLNPWVGKIPWRREWPPTPAVSSWRTPESLVGHSPWSRRVGLNWATQQHLQAHMFIVFRIPLTSRLSQNIEAHSWLAFSLVCGGVCVCVPSADSSLPGLSPLWGPSVCLLGL